MDAFSGGICEFAGDIVEEGEWPMECSGAMLIVLGDCQQSQTSRLRVKLGRVRQREKVIMALSLPV